jgi:hypothetical protein
MEAALSNRSYSKYNNLNDRLGVSLLHLLTNLLTRLDLSLHDISLVLCASVTLHRMRPKKKVQFGKSPPNRDAHVLQCNTKLLTNRRNDFRMVWDCRCKLNLLPSI